MNLEILKTSKEFIEVGLYFTFDNTIRLTKDKSNFKSCEVLLNIPVELVDLILCNYENKILETTPDLMNNLVSNTLDCFDWQNILAICAILNMSLIEVVDMLKNNLAHKALRSKIGNTLNVS